MMKRTISLTAVRPYSTPACRKIKLKLEGILCKSGDGTPGEEFDDDNTREYDDDL